jgi:pimeloyl-ACP methyl ester carboxylesterase
MSTILLIHGLFGSLSAPWITGPFGKARVLTPDLLGYGAFRDGAPEAWTLEDQADHVCRWLRKRVSEPVHVVGHSVGGAVGVMFALRHREMTRSLTSVEGNFTLRDAFWSMKIANLALTSIDAEIAAFRADIAAWVGRSGVLPTPEVLHTAAEWLDNQPSSTLRAQARAVVEATRHETYLDRVRTLAASGLPLHLLAGSRSRSAWDVPQWLSHLVTTDIVVPDAGHLMMLERPAEFARLVSQPLESAMSP